MTFHDRAKKNLFRFVYDIISHCKILEIREYISSMKQYQSFDDYYYNIIYRIDDSKSEGEYDAKTTLAIVAGLYYGRELSLKHLEKECKPDITREQLRQEVITFTRHLLFGKEGSGLEQVGELQIETKGLVPIMDSILARGLTDQEQKSELMSCLRVYGILSERAMQAAMEEADRDPDVILARNTYQNKNIEPLAFVEKILSNSDKKVSFSERVSR